MGKLNDLWPGIGRDNAHRGAGGQQTAHFWHRPFVAADDQGRPVLDGQDDWQSAHRLVLVTAAPVSSPMRTPNQRRCIGRCRLEGRFVAFRIDPFGIDPRCDYPGCRLTGNRMRRLRSGGFWHRHWPFLPGATSEYVIQLIQSLINVVHVSIHFNIVQFGSTRAHAALARRSRPCQVTDIDDWYGRESLQSPSNNGDDR